MNWLEFYQYKLNKNYLQNLEMRYSTFVNLINKEIKERYKVAEFGCGISNITKIISSTSPICQFILVDNNKDMLRLSEQNLAHEDVKFVNFDIRNKFNERVDLIHSHGVLEHLSPNDIKKTISNQLKVCDKLIHYVPSSKYNYKSYGDELLLSKEQWKDLVNPKQIIEFNNGYDLILIW